MNSDVRRYTTMTQRILIVDDALIMRRRIRDVAEQGGWSVAGEAKNGEEAVHLYEETKPDLVTLDIVMPKLDGVSALRRIVDIDPRARIIMVSAVDQKEKLAECIQAGAIDFIVKPIEKLGLQSILEKYLADPTPDRRHDVAD